LLESGAKESTLSKKTRAAFAALQMLVEQSAGRLEVREADRFDA
jgi:hypothetical protein